MDRDLLFNIEFYCYHFNYLGKIKKVKFIEKIVGYIE